MQELPLAIRVGDRVRVRRQRWRVVAARAYESCRLLTLSGLGPLNVGIERSVLAPFDRIEPLERSDRIRVVRPRLWRRRCRTLIASDTTAGNLQCARHAGIDVMPHQLEPALAVVRGLGSRVLLADEVGLGKTIQAGLILAELRARGAADRILVLTPSGLRDQWLSELTDRFGLEFAVIDAREARRRVAQLPAGLNPWTTTPSVIASIDYVKRPELLPAVLSCRWDAIVVDEAHGVTPGSDRFHAVSAFCCRSPLVVLLTATPHNGEREAFEALCGLGSHGDPILVFRRDRREVALGAGRRVHRLAIGSTAAEQQMHALLGRFTQAARAEDGDRWLALATLHKRALSSARSLHESVQRRLADLSDDAGDSAAQLVLPLGDEGGELDPSDQPPIWTTPVLADASRERRLLVRIADAARVAADSESKLRRLARLLARLRKLGEPSIVFTEYRDTLAHVRQTLAIPCALLHGGLSRDERLATLEDFQSGRQSVLLTTDAGGEGLNLHHTCRVVINLELPWNPMRLEQRIGRVDRIGQGRRVHAFNLIASDTGEKRIFDRLKARIDRARRDIGAADPLESSTAAGEDAAARIVLSGEEPATSTDLEPDRSLGRTFVRLSAEAEDERVKVLQVRALAGHDRRAWPLDVDAVPWLASARQPLTRMRLGGSTLVVLQSVIEDATGRLVAIRITPILVDTARRLCRRRAGDARPMLQQLLTGPRLAGATGAVWQADSIRVHRDFWNARLARERAIAASLAGSASSPEFQPGLFDSRAVRERLLQADEIAAALQDTSRYIVFAEAATRIQHESTHAVLVLLP